MREPAPRVLVLGASGLLGRYVALEAARRSLDALDLTIRTGEAPNVPGSTVHRLDWRDHEAAARLLQQLRPDLVINCAGVVNALCSNGLDAVMMNAALPHFLARVLQDWNGRLVHVSTDCVFSGRRGFYSESDVPDPIDLYGRTKLAGELGEAPHLTVRTSFIGLEALTARGLLGWFLAQHGAVPGFRRALWSGLTADTLARLLLDLGSRRAVVGMLHVAGETIDKATLLEWAADLFEKTDVRIEPVDEPVCDRSLISERLSGLGVQVPPIRQMLATLAGAGSRPGMLGGRPQ